MVLIRRRRIDKYLDTLLANQPISDGEATDHCQKGAPQDGGLPELIAKCSAAILVFFSKFSMNITVCSERVSVG